MNDQSEVQTRSYLREAQLKAKDQLARAEVALIKAEDDVKTARMIATSIEIAMRSAT